MSEGRVAKEKATELPVHGKSRRRPVSYASVPGFGRFLLRSRRSSNRRYKKERERTGNGNP